MIPAGPMPPVRAAIKRATRGQHVPVVPGVEFGKPHHTPIVRVPDAERDGWDSETFRAYGITALPTTGEGPPAGVQA